MKGLTGQRRQKDRAAILRPLEVMGLLADGRVPLADFGKELTVNVPRNEESRAGDTIRLIKDGVSVFDYELTQEDAANVDFKAVFKLPGNLLPPDIDYLAFTLDYDYVFSTDNETRRSGHRFTVIYDRQPPGGTNLQPLRFTDKQKLGITRDDLVDEQVPVDAWPWLRMDVGDVITPWVSTSPPLLGDEAQYLLTDQEVTITSNDVGNRISLRFPAKALAPPGKFYFAYRLRDKLGNTSKLSPTDLIPVDLKSLDSPSQRM